MRESGDGRRREESAPCLHGVVNRTRRVVCILLLFRLRVRVLVACCLLSSTPSYVYVCTRV